MCIAFRYRTISRVGWAPCTELKPFSARVSGGDLLSDERPQSWLLIMNNRQTAFKKSVTLSAQISQTSLTAN
jgi:hypothetical protein